MLLKLTRLFFKYTYCYVIHSKKGKTLLWLRLKIFDLWSLDWFCHTHASLLLICAVDAVEFGRKSIINQNFESCCFQSVVSLIDKVNQFTELKLAQRLNKANRIQSYARFTVSLKNLHDKTTLVQYSIYNLNWQNFSFHNLFLAKLHSHDLHFI